MYRLWFLIHSIFEIVNIDKDKSVAYTWKCIKCKDKFASMSNSNKLKSRKPFHQIKKKLNSNKQTVLRINYVSILAVPC